MGLILCYLLVYYLHITISVDQFDWLCMPTFDSVYQFNSLLSVGILFTYNYFCRSI